MSTGTNAPSVAELNKWFDDILRFPKQVERLDLEQLDFLKEHLRQNNLYQRDIFERKLSKERKSEIKIIRDKVYREEIEEIKEEKLNGYEQDVALFERLISKDIDWWLDEFIDNLNVPLAEDIFCHDDFSVPCDFCYTAMEEWVVMELINDRIYNLEKNSNNHSEKTCSTIFKNNLAVFVYGCLRYLDEELQFKLGTYKTSKEAGKVIGEIIYRNIPFSSNWSLANIQRYVGDLYNAVIKNKKIINWENIEGKDDFNRRFENVRLLKLEEIKAVKKCILKYKEI